MRSRSLCPDRALDGGDAAMRGKGGDQIGQESRSAGLRAETSVTSMDITMSLDHRAATEVTATDLADLQDRTFARATSTTVNTYPPNDGLLPGNW